ncbi:MAG: hypothetical protein WAV25_02415 [Minisyncoccia bacterium]
MRSNKRGTTLECWNDYASRLPQGTKNCVESREGLRSFLGVSFGAVRRYISNPKSLKGLSLVKMRYFLTALGYSVTDLESMPAAARKFGELVAYDVLSMSDATAILNYKDDHGVFRVLHGQSTEIADSRLICMSEYASVHQKELDKRKKEWRQAWGINMEETALAAVESPVTKSAPTSHKKTGDDDIIIFGGLVRALLPVASRLSSDDCTPEDRNNARSNAGGQAVFQLSNALNRLCSETARNQYKGRST